MLVDKLWAKINSKPALLTASFKQIFTNKYVPSEAWVSFRTIPLA